MSSSVREKIYEVEKQKKIQRRIAKEQANATEKRQEPENNQPEHSQVEEGKISTETGDSDSTYNGREVETKNKKTKKKAKKTSKKT